MTVSAASASPTTLRWAFTMSACRPRTRRSGRVRPLDHGAQQHVAAGGEIVAGRVLDLVVADAVLAGHEDHGGGRDARHVDRIVAGAADDLAAGIAERIGRLLHRGGAFRRE